MIQFTWKRESETQREGGSSHEEREKEREKKSGWWGGSRLGRGRSVLLLCVGLVVNVRRSGSSADDSFHVESLPFLPNFTASDGCIHIVIFPSNLTSGRISTRSPPLICRPLYDAGPWNCQAAHLVKIRRFSSSALVVPRAILCLPLAVTRKQFKSKGNIEWKAFLQATS